MKILFFPSHSQIAYSPSSGSQSKRGKSKQSPKLGTSCAALHRQNSPLTDWPQHLSDPLIPASAGLQLPRGLGCSFSLLLLFPPSSFDSFVEQRTFPNRKTEEEETDAHTHPRPQEPPQFRSPSSSLLSFLSLSFSSSSVFHSFFTFKTTRGTHMRVYEPRKGFPGCQMQEVWVRSLGQEEPLEMEMANPFSILI